MIKILHKSYKGFTLIELLVVIAVIGMLASIVLVSLGPARSKARDARRVSDIRQISLAMELCYQDANCAGKSVANDSSYLLMGVTSGAGRIALAAIGSYMPTVPQDPGGGVGACTDVASPTETAGGAYCGVASVNSTVTEYCIFARLSDSRVFAASKKGGQYMPTSAIPTSITTCP